MKPPHANEAKPDKSKLGRHPAIGALKDTFAIVPGAALDPSELTEMEANLERTARLIEEGLSR